MRGWTNVVGAALLGSVFVVVLGLPGLSDGAILVLSNGFQLLAAAVAALGCAVAARRTSGQRRRAWWWVSASAGSWAGGQAIWTYYEVALDREVPFPSAADVGFVLFPLLAAVGLLTWLGTQSDQLVARGRDVLDGAIIAVSLLALSWVTTLGSVIRDNNGADVDLPFLLSLAYPLGDLVLATLVLLALARGRGAERATLLVLACGLGGLALADSAYVYLVSTGSYSSADVISSGWVFGFLLVGAAGFGVTHADAHDAGHSRGAASLGRPSALRMALPYVPLSAAGLALCLSLLDTPGTPTAEVLLGVALVVVVLSRQFLAMADNQRLLTELGQARDALEHQALHDALTGLANRVLFSDRLHRALLAPSARVSVLFCDLDDFKNVNDQLGHEAGDRLLEHVASRLLDCVRLTDTVARLGGDEFAILLEDSADAVQVADRIVEAMKQPVQIGDRSVQTSISVGIAHHEGPGPVVEPDRRTSELLGTRTPTARALAGFAEQEATATLLLRRADSAMYAAKGAGKSRAVLAEHAERELMPTPASSPLPAG